MIKKKTSNWNWHFPLQLFSYIYSHIFWLIIMSMELCLPCTSPEIGLVPYDLIHGTMLLITRKKRTEFQFRLQKNNYTYEQQSDFKIHEERKLYRELSNIVSYSLSYLQSTRNLLTACQRQHHLECRQDTQTVEGTSWIVTEERGKTKLGTSPSETRCQEGAQATWWIHRTSPKRANIISFTCSDQMEAV